MAIRKEEAQNATDRAAHQAGDEQHRGAHEAVDATRRMAESAADQSKRMGETAGEQGKRSAEATAEAVRNVTQFGRDQSQRTAEMAQQGVREAANMLGAAGKSYGEIAEHSRANVEAALHSGARIARGLQEMGWEVARFSQDTLRSGFKAASDILHCRSLEDVVEVQSHFVQESLDRAIDQQARLLRLSRAAADEAEQVILHRPHGAAPGAQARQ
jgi:hypothetical protein